MILLSKSNVEIYIKIKKNKKYKSKLNKLMINNANWQT